jgi:3-oxoacyl-[acyl-carrier protein] reductase
MDLGLKGRVAVVMGASQGLGKASALQLAAEGAKVVLVSRSAENLELVKSEIEAAGGSAQIQTCDLFDAESRAEFVNFLGTLPQLDVLIANSGGPAPGMAPGIASETWTREFDAMVVGIIEIVDASVAQMKPRGFGRIVVIASSGVVVPIPKLAVSNTLRSAVAGYIKTLAEQMAPHGITCNLVLPGRIETPRTQAIDKGTAANLGISIEEARAASAATIPMGRYGKPEEFGAVVTFIASAPAAYITGSQIRVDGGSIKSINA